MTWNLFIDTIKGAFEKGNLSDEQELRNALQYENSLGTLRIYKAILEKLETHPAADFIETNETAPGRIFYDKDPRLISECRRLLNLTSLSSSVTNHIKPVEHFIEDSGDIDRTINEIKRLGQVKKNRSQRLKVIKPIWKQHIASRNDHWFWLSESQSKSHSKTKLHLQKLGLFHYRERKKGDQFLQFQFKTTQSFKPSWLDADLAFYFDASPDYTENGYTRDLATGTIGLKEWVTYVKHIKLWDVTVIELNEDTSFDVLTNQFLDSHKMRIIAARK